MEVEMERVRSVYYTYVIRGAGSLTVNRTDESRKLATFVIAVTEKKTHTRAARASPPEPIAARQRAGRGSGVGVVANKVQSGFFGYKYEQHTYKRGSMKRSMCG